MLKNIFLILLPLLLLSLKPSGDRPVQKKKFTFAAWGGLGKGTEEEQYQRMKAFADAGVTDLFADGDAKRLESFVKMGNKLGVRIHSWHWMMNVGNREECREHPDWYSVNRLGQSCRDFHPYVNYYSFLSPFSPGAREYVKKGVREIAKVKGLVSVNFDYIRYVDVVLGADLQKKYKHNGGPLKQDRLLPEYDFGYHPLAREEYKKKFGIDPVELEDVEENATWQQFRMDAISSLVEECVQLCHEEGVKASADVFPFPQLAREYVRQDWAHWNVDLFLPMVYKKDHQGNVNWVGFATRQGVRDLKAGQELYTGIAVPHYGDNFSDFEQAIVQVHENGANGISFFSSNALNSQHLEIIKKYNKIFNQ